MVDGWEYMPALEQQVRNQYAAMRFVVERGRALQQLHPEIADDYRDGSTLAQLVDAYQIRRTFRLRRDQRDAAVQIVYRALVGNRDWWGPEYAGLLSTREARRIGRAHIVQTARANGAHMQKLGVGIFAATPEERAAYASIGGKVGGARVKELGVGYCGLTPEERREASRKGTAALGLTPWERDELAVAYLLSKRRRYQDPRKGCGVRHQKVAERLNEIFHEGEGVRSRNSVACMWRRQETALREIRKNTEYLTQMRGQYLRWV